jgi:hypothetical protein
MRARKSAGVALAHDHGDLRRCRPLQRADTAAAELSKRKRHATGDKKQRQAEADKDLSTAGPEPHLGRMP